MSVSPCWRRISRLEQSGFIVRRVAVVDAKKVGLNLQVFVTVKMSVEGRSNVDDFSAAINNLPEVIECFPIMGTFDYILRVVCKDIDWYEKFFYKSLSKLPGVSEVSSMVAFSNVKKQTFLPLS